MHLTLRYSFVCVCVLQTHPDAWPFMEPVKKSEAPDYYEIIRFPIGQFVLIISTIYLTFFISVFFF